MIPTKIKIPKRFSLNGFFFIILVKVFSDMDIPNKRKFLQKIIKNAVKKQGLSLLVLDYLIYFKRMQIEYDWSPIILHKK